MTATPAQAPPTVTREPPPRRNWLLLGMAAVVSIVVLISGCSATESEERGIGTSGPGQDQETASPASGTPSPASGTPGDTSSTDEAQPPGKAASTPEADPDPTHTLAPDPDPIHTLAPDPDPTHTLAPDPVLPAAPSGLQVSGWTDGTANMGYSDNSDNEEGFYVYVGGSRYKTLAVNVTTFTVTPGCDEVWSVSVTAFNSAGESGATNTTNVGGACP